MKTIKEQISTIRSTIEFRNLTKHFGEVVAVDNVTLSISGGEFITLLGPSGSGKTTTLLMIAGFETPTHGDIIIAEQSIIRTPPNKRNIGLVFQSYALFPHMTVFDNIAFPLQERKVSQDRIDKRVEYALELVRLPDHEERYPHQLSGGQQQRIALARAIVFEPSILLMDEPLGALDRKLRAEMQLELRRLHERLPVTTVYVTHDQEEALVMSDRILVLNDGKLEQMGTPEEVYEKPINRFVAGFVGETNFLTGKIVRQEGKAITVKVQSGLSFQCLAHSGSNIDNNEVTVSLRPEKIILAPAKTKDVNCVRGIVEESVYLGHSSRYQIRIGDDLSLTMIQANRAKSARAVKNERILIGWEIQDARIV
jgi:spermidine/putrescine ABC transporter ATP-binding subunit